MFKRQSGYTGLVEELRRTVHDPRPYYIDEDEMNERRDFVCSVATDDINISIQGYDLFVDEHDALRCSYSNGFTNYKPVFIDNRR